MARISRTTFAFAVIAGLIAALNAKAASTTTVPIRLYDTEAPVVLVRIQGQEVPLQLDLGDESSLVLHPEVLATLRSEPTGDTFKAFSMDGELQTPIVRLDLVQIGDLKLYGVTARQDAHSEFFLNNKKTLVGALGFIGAGLFKSGQIRLDYPHTRLTLSLPGETGAVSNICRGRTVPFVTNEYGFTTPVKTDVGELQLGWDTGSPVILLSQTAATTAHLEASLESTESRKFIVGGKDFGPQRIEIWNNIPLPKEIAGLIGHPFFQEHVVCFDYPKRRLHLQ
jgi:hypothetical protein